MGRAGVHMRTFWATRIGFTLVESGSQPMTPPSQSDAMRCVILSKETGCCLPSRFITNIPPPGKLATSVMVKKTKRSRGHADWMRETLRLPS
jgi:hypothetical protein